MRAGLLRIIAENVLSLPVRPFFATTSRNLKTEAAWVSEKMRRRLNAKMFKVDFHADAS